MSLVLFFSYPKIYGANIFLKFSLEQSTHSLKPSKLPPVLKLYNYVEMGSLTLSLH